MPGAEAVKFQYNVEGKNVYVDGLWQLNIAAPGESLHRTLDVTLDLVSIGNNPALSPTSSALNALQLRSDDRASSFLIRHLYQPLPASSVLAIKFILPVKSGFTVRSDFLERRLEGYEHALSVESFLTPREEIKAPDFRRLDNESPLSLLDLLPHAVGAVQVQSEQHLAGLEAELVNRLSFAWISPELIEEKRIAWIKGKEDLESGRRIWEAARALGIKVVILDHDGHWFQKDDDRWNYLREAFIPTDITADQGFVDRIVAAVRSYDKPIHALVTVNNAGAIGTARACQILGFRSAPPESYIIAGDKFKTREMEPDNGGAFKVFNIDELRTRLRSKVHSPIEYPVIVKPCMGWGSECVSKVQTEEELIQAVARASSRHSEGPNPRSDVMVEPYIDGPEVDANFVLIEGNIIFFEVADDFPKAGEKAGNALNGSFMETDMVLPTGLSPKEIQVTKDSILQTLLRQGFRTGVFHCEGRVRYASKEYDTRDGIVDLYPSDRVQGKEPSFYLHEINARPGGYFVSSATLLTYGVDYYANHILAALGDFDRCRALSVPFCHGPQWWVQVIIIPEDKSGVMKSPDAGKEMLERHEDLRLAVVDYKTMKKKGDKLLGPKAKVFSYLAYFSVASRRSREDCLRLGQKVRRSFTYEIE
ncbi:ATP-grasp domain protein [Aspergillus parasiticus SU-1]|uniref:ATP-grasp domain protein n=1 Tax=Aspergillus parasiticus (strain ATCC 56775 / NRRL 5862 / SRRC 143 / SU-1) TaxID=1403190 RepID=A0A0F0IK78_ASPPU|nr:ATP-grasp domain protein [Aspergillus parasiticus SU-1]